MRGRGGNRKGPNPLTRSYESNGPDVKIRGSAQQIADKYSTLARDAQSAGDRVIAENYLQHAEHYNRIIAAAQAQMAPQQNRDTRDDADDNDSDSDTNETQYGERKPEKAATNDGSGPQPVIDGVPVEVSMEQETASASKPARKQRQRSGQQSDNTAQADASGETGGDAEASGDGEEAPKRRRSYKSRAKRDDEDKSSSDRDDGDSVLEAAQ
jgi:hypothetical protein